MISIASTPNLRGHDGAEGVITRDQQGGHLNRFGDFPASLSDPTEKTSKNSRVKFEFRNGPFLEDGLFPIRGFFDPVLDQFFLGHLL